MTRYAMLAVFVALCGVTAEAANTVTFAAGSPALVQGLKIDVEGTCNPDSGWSVSNGEVFAKRL